MSSMTYDYDRFDWDKAAASNCPETIDYFKEHFKEVISEERYVQEIRALQHHHPIHHGNNSPSYRRHQYRDLKRKFGFFTGELA